MKQKNDLVIIEEKKSTEKEDLPYIFVTKFDDQSVSDFYKNFLAFSSKESVKIIPIVISSFGGQVHSLLSMLDIIKTSKKPVATIALGKAMSCGAVLLASGTKGYRYSAPNADIMVHEVSNMDYGKTTDLDNNTRHTKFLNKKLFRILKEQSNYKKDLMKLIKAKGNIDLFLTTKQFKKYGLVDHEYLPNFIKI